MTLTFTRDDAVAEDFRAAMRNVAAAVSVVTTFDSDERPHGTTVSAFMPLSMDPALLLVSLHNTSRMLSLLTPRKIFGVNVLASHQADLGEQFARRATDRWNAVAWEKKAGAPAIRGGHAYVSLITRRLIREGDHTLVVGAVRRADWSPGEPLAYWQRSFGSFVRRPAPEASPVSPGGPRLSQARYTDASSAHLETS